MPAATRSSGRSQPRLDCSASSAAPSSDTASVRSVCRAERGRCPVSDTGQRVERKQCVLTTADDRRLSVLKSVTQVTTGYGTYFVESILDLTEQTRRQSLVTTMSRELSSSLEVETVLETTARRFAELLDIAGCVVYRLAGDELVCVVSVEDGARLHDRAGRRVGLAERCADRTAIETRAPVVVDSSDDPRLSALEREAMRTHDERAALIVPMIARDSVIGTIELTETHRERVFTADEVATAEGLAGVVALALQNAELYRDQTERTERLASLLEASRAISSSLVVDEVLDTLVRRAAETLRADISMLFAYDAASGTITPRAIFEREATPYEDLGKPRPLSEYPQGREILEGGEVRLECISDPQLDPESRASMQEWNEKSALSVPLSFHAEPMGMLVITDTVAERRTTRPRSSSSSRLLGSRRRSLCTTPSSSRLSSNTAGRSPNGRGARRSSTRRAWSSPRSLEVEKVLETTVRRFEELDRSQRRLRPVSDRRRRARVCRVRDGRRALPGVGRQAAVTGRLAYRSPCDRDPHTSHRRFDRRPPAQRGRARGDARVGRGGRPRPADDPQRRGDRRHRAGDKARRSRIQQGRHGDGRAHARVAALAIEHAGSLAAGPPHTAADLDARRGQGDHLVAGARRGAGDRRGPGRGGARLSRVHHLRLRRRRGHPGGAGAPPVRAGPLRWPRRAHATQ